MQTMRIWTKATMVTAIARLTGLIVVLGMMGWGRSDAMGANGAASLVFAPGARLELTGDSTLHHYSAKASGVKVEVGTDAARPGTEIKPADLAALVRSHFVKTFELSVPVDKLASGEKKLDANMRKALKGDQFKEIRFHMESYDVGAPAAGAGLALVLHGRLSLAGVERKIDVSATAVPVSAGLRLAGSKDLLMTDYQIKPPTMLLGTVKTANLITVKFDAILQSGKSP